MRTTLTITRGFTMPTLAHMLQQRRWRFLGTVLGLLLAATAACGPSEPAVPMFPAPHIQRSSNPAWRVAPSVEQQIFRSTTIVRATLQSATAAVETLPSDPGVASTYQAVQELRFTVHEYLKGSGPTALLVVVRGGHGYLTEPEAREYADYRVQARVTTWDERQAVLFLEAPAQPYTPAAASGGAAGTSETTSPAVLQFTRFNYNQPPWAYSVDTLSRAWLPAQDTPAEGGTPTAFITDGAQSPSPTITLADLRARIAALAAELQAGAGVDGYAACIYSRFLRERYRRADPWTPTLIDAALASGISTGSEVYEQDYDYDGPQYHRYWLSGPDAALFQPVIVDDDGQASTGYRRTLTAARPLPAGEYDVFHNSQHYARFSCAFAPLDAYLAVTVTVTAPTGTMHEAFFDPAALGERGGRAGRRPRGAFAGRGGRGHQRRRGRLGQQRGGDPAAADLGRRAAAAGRDRQHPGRPAAGADSPGRDGGAAAARRRGDRHGHGGAATSCAGRSVRNPGSRASA